MNTSSTFGLVSVAIPAYKSEYLSEAIWYLIDRAWAVCNHLLHEYLGGWDHVEFHPMGERLFGINDYGSLGNFFEYWNIRLKVATECFKTLPIDLYIEFGKIGAIIFLLILSCIFKKIIGKDGIRIWNVGLAFWYYQLCISGIFSFAKRGETNYKILFLIIVFSIYLYIRKERALNKIWIHHQHLV